MTMSIRNKAIALTAALACATALAVAPTMAQQRPDQSPMLKPPPAPPSQGAVASARFRQAYVAAGSPKIVVLWNRVFDDEVASTYKERNTPDGRVVEERLVNKRADLVAEPIEWEVERAFTRTLVASGARLVDRNAMMRLQGLQDKAERGANVQAIETRALIGRADIMIEVLQTEDKRLDEGISFRVTAKSVRDAEVLADVLSAGRPPARPMPLVAADVPGGFVRAQQSDASPSDVGRQLAIEVMNSLAGNLRR